MPYKVREVTKSLKTKGFREGDSHHKYYYFFHGDNKVSSIYTKISHGATEINDNLLSQMARQLKLTVPQFRELVDCKLKYEGYVKIMETAGEL